ncbi:MAG: DNA polymerase III subunit beta [Candidatus Rifleibacteriota bacterium]
MKFQLELKSLSEAIGIAGHAVAVRSVRPILSNLLITANGNELRFVGTDLEIMMICKAKARVERNGHFTIPAKLLQEIVSCIPGEPDELVTFEMDPENEISVNITCGRNKFNLQIQGIEDFPPVPVFDGEEIPIFELQSEVFAKALKEASIAMGTEEGNPVQRSICIDFSDEHRPVLVATDSKRLSVARIDNTSVPEAFRNVFIVPARAVHELQKLADSTEKILVGIYKGQLVFTTENFQLITRLIDGRFPDYKRVLPKESSRVLKINRKEFSQALKAVQPIARNKSGQVLLEISQNETRVWCETKELGKAEIFVPSELQGEPINIAFNVKFIQDFINVIVDEQVVLGMTTPSYPGLLKPGNPESDFQYVLMPMSYAEN